MLYICLYGYILSQNKQDHICSQHKTCHIKKTTSLALRCFLPFIWPSHHLILCTPLLHFSMLLELPGNGADVDAW